MQKRSYPLIALFALLLLFTGCGDIGDATAPPSSETIDVLDALGNTVTLTRNPQRLIVIDPAACDIIYAIGAQNALVAVGSYCEYPEEVAGLIKVGAYDQLNIEELVALSPDLIVFGTMSTDEAKIESLKQAGIEVIVRRGDSLEDTYANIEMFGELLGRAEQATAVIGDMRAQLAAISDAASTQGEKPKVYIEISPLEYGLYSCGDGTFQSELTAIAGGENIFAGQQGWIAVSEEQIIQLNPDVILSTSMYEGYDPMVEIAGRTGWEGISAVQNGRIHYVDPSMISLACPRLVLGANAVNGLLFPAQ